MIKLNGTEKQIEWAESIREAILNGSAQGVNSGIEQEVARLEKSLISDIEDLETETDADEIEDIKKDIKSGKRKIELFNELKKRVENETDSTWFIDNKVNHVLFTKEVLDVAYNERGNN